MNEKLPIEKPIIPVDKPPKIKYIKTKWTFKPIKTLIVLGILTIGYMIVMNHIYVKVKFDNSGVLIWVGRGEPIL